MPGASNVQPAKIVLEWRPRAGREADFETWVRSLMAAASRAPALQGSSVLTASGGDRFVLLRFSSQAELDRWRSTPEVVALLEEGTRLAATVDAPVVRTRLETWFTLPGMPRPSAAPPRWKMALVTWCALVPQILLLGELIPGGTPFLLSLVLSTAIPVSMLTWVLMPFLTRVLYGWLYRHESGTAARARTA